MEADQWKQSTELLLQQTSSNPNSGTRQRPTPKRFVKSQIPDSILNDPSLNAAIALLPSNYSFEVHKCIWRVKSTGAKRVALQFPEGLLMYSLVLSDIFTTFAGATHCFVLGDVTYGACCIDDLAASALGSDILILVIAALCQLTPPRFLACMCLSISRLTSNTWWTL